MARELVDQNRNEARSDDARWCEVCGLPPLHERLNELHEALRWLDQL